MKAASYYRVSSQQQQERQSIALQKTRLHKFARDKGYEIVAEYEDDGISGEEIERRPGFRQVLEAIENDGVEVLLVFMVDRIGRFKKRRDRHFITQLLEDHGVSIDSPYHGFYDCKSEEDLNKLEADLVESRRDNKMRGIRISEGHLEARRQKGFSGGRLPYGLTYDKANKSFLVNEQQHSTLKKALELLTSGYGAQKVARVLNSDLNQHPLPLQKRRKARHWWASVIRNMLRNDFYFTGILKPRREKTACGSDSLPVDTGVRLFTEEEIGEARRRMAERCKYDKRTLGKGEKVPFLLAGLLKCGECGATVGPQVSSKSGREPLRYYRCRGYTHDGCGQRRGYQADVLESWAWDKFTMNFLGNSEAVESAILAEEFFQDVDRDKLNAMVRGAEKALAELEEERRKLLHQHQKGYLDDSELDERMAEIIEARAKMDDDLRKAKQQLARPDQIRTAIREATRMVADEVLYVTLWEEFQRESHRFWSLPQKEQDRIEREEPDHPYVKLCQRIDEMIAKSNPSIVAKLYADQKAATRLLPPQVDLLACDNRRNILRRLLGPEGFFRVHRPGDSDSLHIEIFGAITRHGDRDDVFSNQSF